MSKRTSLTLFGSIVAGGLLVWVLSCMNLVPRPSQAKGQSQSCRLVEEGFGPAGKVPLHVEAVAHGLEVPWGLAFISERDLLVTERPGRLRLIQNWKLIDEPVATTAASDTSEGGLLGVVLHPDFTENRLFYLYRTIERDEAPFNRVERWSLSENYRSATFDRVVLDRIPAATYHNGGRLRFGPDRMLYIATGDARDADRSQDSSSLAGKLLRVTADGQPASGNPFGNTPVYLLGIRNLQAFDWADKKLLLLADHGPSGEMLRFGHDEVSLARAGDNLGWPAIYGCDAHPELVSPMLSWEAAMPPGGAAIYTGSAIPEFKGNLLVTSLGAEQLQRLVLAPENPGRLVTHESYLRGTHGRLRDAIMGPDQHLYLTTSNCDSRGDCPDGGDEILRVTRAQQVP